eukprot:204298-Rhodomonas_salina.2
MAAAAVNSGVVFALKYVNSCPVLLCDAMCDRACDAMRLRYSHRVCHAMSGTETGVCITAPVRYRDWVIADTALRDR